MAQAVASPGLAALAVEAFGVAEVGVLHQARPVAQHAPVSGGHHEGGGWPPRDERIFDRGAGHFVHGMGGGLGATMASRKVGRRQVGARARPGHSGAMDAALATDPRFDVLLGRAAPDSPMLGVLGTATSDRDRVVAMDLAEMHCMALFGEPGAGKSYCMGTIIEMALAACPHINRLPRPLAGVVFHFSSSQRYQPELATAMHANDRPAQVAELLARYRAAPRALEDCLLLAPRDVVAERAREFPGIPVAPLTFTAGELQAGHWRILMGALGEEDSLYLQVINQILKRRRNALSLEAIAGDLGASALSQPDRERAQVRLSLAGSYLDDRGVPVRSHIRSGRLVLVDLRDEFLQKKEALAVLLVLLQLVADADESGRPLQKLCVFDEAHKYLKDPELVEALTETIREMRHKSMSVLIASQDPPSVPLPMIELSTMVVLLRMSSPLWLEHVARVKPAFREIAPAAMAALAPGEAFVWAAAASDRAYVRQPCRMRVRPRFTRHGGETKATVPIHEAPVAPATLARGGASSAERS